MTSRTITGNHALSDQSVRIEMLNGIVKGVELLSKDDDLPWLSAALVDVQVNGYGGHDVNASDFDVDDVLEMASVLREAGTGTWVPTIITQSHEYISERLHTLAEATRRFPHLRRVIPFAHVEGPFISPMDGPRGAHAVEHVRDIDVEEIAAWNEVFPIGYVTISPHWPDAARKVASIRRLGVQVAIGHTHATPEEVRQVSTAGATISTHLGNGLMAELPRHPNLLWEQIADRTLTAGLIADGHHLPAAVIETIVRAKGPHSCVFVSDSVSLAGSAPGRYHAPVGGDVILQENGRLCLAEDERLLAGSAASLADCVRFAATSTSLTLHDTFTMSTETPGRLFRGREGWDSIGTIVPGRPADIVLWDHDLNVLEVLPSD